MKFGRWCLCLLNLVWLLWTGDILDDVDNELIRMLDGDVVEIVNSYWECKYISWYSNSETRIEAMILMFMGPYVVIQNS